MKQKHHIVQDKYLAQWKVGDQLNIYIISENKIVKRGTKWKGFVREDYNVFIDEGIKSYLPEKITSVVDTAGIETIKAIDPDTENQLSGYERSALAFYVALQFIRTPKYREELNKMIDSTIRSLMKEDISSPEKVNLLKKDVLKHTPLNKQEEEALQKISTMSDEEIQKQVYESLHNDDFTLGVTNTGHSKIFFKLQELSKKVFEGEWSFLIAPKGTSFITSDSPCFAISSHKFIKGLVSPFSTIIFPLRPDVCIYIKAKLSLKKEKYVKIDKQRVRDINKLILKNSYQCVIAKDEKHLQALVKGFDPIKHKKSRDVAVTKNGPYVMFSFKD